MNIVDVLRRYTLPEFYHTPFRGDDTGVIVTIGILEAAIDEIEGLRNLLKFDHGLIGGQEVRRLIDIHERQRKSILRLEAQVELWKERYEAVLISKNNISD